MGIAIVSATFGSRGDLALEAPSADAAGRKWQRGHRKLKRRGWIVRDSTVSIDTAPIPAIGWRKSCHATYGFKRGSPTPGAVATTEVAISQGVASRPRPSLSRCAVFASKVGVRCNDFADGRDRSGLIGHSHACNCRLAFVRLGHYQGVRLLSVTQQDNEAFVTSAWLPNRGSGPRRRVLSRCCL
jgi:hypothetical protein